MNPTIKITNKEVYNFLQVEVDTTSLSALFNNEFQGCITIYDIHGVRSFDGEHGANDFSKAWGFTLVEA